jgi:hypothetical protein
MPKETSGKIGELNKMLGPLENHLLHRSLDRTREEVEHAYEFINGLADEGVIDIDCAKCADEIDPDLEDVRE